MDGRICLEQNVFSHWFQVLIKTKKPHAEPDQRRKIQTMRLFPVQAEYLVEPVFENPAASSHDEKNFRGLGNRGTILISKETANVFSNAVRPTSRRLSSSRTCAFDYSRARTLSFDIYDQIPSSSGIRQASFRDGSSRMNGEGVCRTALDLHAAFACVHRCQYCSVDLSFRIACDLENPADRIPKQSIAPDTPPRNSTNSTIRQIPSPLSRNTALPRY